MTDEAQFVADAMLGKLTKWLRVMGIDVMYDSDVIDAQLLQCAERQGRILLTRDGGLMRRRGPAQRLYIESDYYHEQVRQVVQAFRLAESIQMFSRCLQCNALLGAIAKQLVAARVPPYVYASQMTFKHCAICDRLYWGGTHRDNMLRQLQAMLSGLLTISTETIR
jgi:uncharacterized protein with PIN domain